MTTKNFLIKHNISPDCYNLEELVNFILSEMHAGLTGKQSSLAMLNSYCKPVSDLPLEKKVIVIDAGGTNLRTASVYFNLDGEAIIEDFVKTSMPGINREVSSKQFFAFFADQVERFLPVLDTFGFCFSYAVEILPNCDGIPLLISKEVKAPQIVGKKLGEELFYELSLRGYDMTKDKIIIMNDTVTTLLAGLSQTNKLNCNGCIGLILGTGTNTAFIGEDGIINEESGNLKINLGDIDSSFVKSTLDPDSHIFEKLVSGAYLGPLTLHIIKAAKSEGFFSECFSKTLTEIKDLSTKDMCSFFDNVSSPFDMSATESDKEVIKEIIETVIKRAAKLTASNLAASVLITQFGKDKPVLINADGTTFYSTPFLKEYTEKYLKDFLKERGRKAIFTNIKNSPIIGSAIGALSL